MDVNVVAVTLDKQDVIQAYRRLHQIDLHGDGFRGRGCVAQGFHLSLERIDILRQRAPAFFRFVVLERRSPPFVGEGDGQGKKDRKDRKEGYQYPLGDHHADSQKFGNGHTSFQRYEAGIINDRAQNEDGAKNQEGAPSQEGPFTALNEVFVDQPASVRQIEPGVNQDEESIKCK